MRAIGAASLAAMLIGSLYYLAWPTPPSPSSLRAFDLLFDRRILAILWLALFFGFQTLWLLWKPRLSPFVPALFVLQGLVLGFMVGLASVLCVWIFSSPSAFLRMFLAAPTEPLLIATAESVGLGCPLIGGLIHSVVFLQKGNATSQ